jgi:hypothetical protein
MHKFMGIFYLLLMISIGSILSGCRMDPNEEFIQGSWYYLDPHLEQMTSEAQLEVFWTFDRGAYEYYACCFVKQHQTGRYAVIRSEGDDLYVELFNPNGNTRTEAVEFNIVVNREAGTIKIPGSGEFTRTMP